MSAAEFALGLSAERFSLGEALFETSSLLTGRRDAALVGAAILDELADSVPEPTVPGLVGALFGVGGLRGDVENYHAAENSFLDRVLERREGMPITLSAVVVEVADRCGLETHMIGMPGHVVVGTSDADVFIDAFGGTALTSSGLAARFSSIFGREAVLPAQALVPMRVSDVVHRITNNLLRTWSRAPGAELDLLLELRTHFTNTAEEARVLSKLAVGRGRYDLAARLRELQDPDDPEAMNLWARLN